MKTTPAKMLLSSCSSFVTADCRIYGPYWLTEVLQSGRLRPTSYKAELRLTSRHAATTISESELEHADRNHMHNLTAFADALELD
jgi:hypothetical protein